MTPTAPDLAELRRLAEAATPGPWAARYGVSWEARVCATTGSLADVDSTANAELIAAAVNALPGLLDAAAERDALAAKVERVRALHRPAYNDTARSPICPDCDGKAGVHPCGCWADTDYEPVCAVCNQGHKGMSVPWPCETIRAIDTTPDTGGES